jgi:hypothetical protein
VKCQTLDQFITIRSPWLTVIGEHLTDEQGQILHYWRVEKADSVIILPLSGERFYLTAPQYRPGIGNSTVDFPGGRVLANQDVTDAARQILLREQGLPEECIFSLQYLNPGGWAINSSFSNQRLHAFVAEIQPEAIAQAKNLGASYPVTQQGITDLLRDLDCLQCRAVLLEWVLHSQASSGSGPNGLRGGNAA